MFIPDQAKGDILKIFSTPVWQALLIAWKARLPATPPFTDQLHTVACQYAFREGYQKAMDDLALIPHESAPQPSADDTPEAIRKRTVLLDPKD